MPDFPLLLRLVESAMALPAAERSDFLRKRCADDESLYLAALRLTAAAEREGVRLAASSLASTVGLPVGESVSSSAGGASSAQRFRILKPHAKGGLGEVFVAEDGELRREVALKEIQRRYADDPAARRRFTFEAEVTGGLEHPGVVPVYGLGAHDDGRPFYAMRFVRGDDLRTAIKRFHGTPERADFQSMAFRSLLRRFLDVCNAVGYAHSRGVLHRDLKPGNIMLGPFGETLVVDWGLAKIVGRDDGDTLRAASEDSEGDTSPGSAIGTPAYMSPEQAEGRVDELGPATDVYALGAVLHSLLTGNPPVDDAGGLPAILERVRRGELLDAPQAPKALAAVARKATSLCAADRYATTAELAADVERWLADEPVSAFQEPRRVRARRWMRKHPGATAGGAVSLLLLLAFFMVGFVVVTGYNRRLAAANGEARKNFEAAKNAVESYFVTVSEDEKLKHGDFTELRKRLLGTAIPFFETLKRQKPGDEQVEAGRAGAHLRLADIQHETGQSEAARENYRSAVAIYGRLAVERPDQAEYANRLAQSHNNFGHLLTDLGEHGEAETQYRTALGLHQRLSTEQPGRLEFLSRSAAGHVDMGLLLKARGDFQGAVAEFETAIAVQRRLLDMQPGAFNYRSHLMSSYANLGDALHGLGDAKSAAARRQDANDLAEQLLKESPHDLGAKKALAANYGNLGNRLFAMGDLAAAKRRHEQSLALWNELAGTFASVPEYQSNVAGAHNNLGNVALQSRDFEAAKKHYRVGVATLERLVGAFPGTPDFGVNLGGNYCNFAILTSSDDPRGSIEWFDKAVTTLKGVLNKSPSNAVARAFLCNSLGGRAFSFERLTQYAEAADDYAHAAEFVDGAIRRGHESSKARCLEMAAHRESFERILSGGADALDPTRRAYFARHCYHKALYVRSLKEYERATTERPALVAECGILAARAAALSAAGKGSDSAGLSAEQRPANRRKALAWLDEEFRRQQSIMKGADPANASTAARLLADRLVDADLTTVRDDDSLTALPEAERVPWRKFWIDVRRALGHSERSPIP
jgi:tetratricopeptide (TPR) repeat protein/tRNA A-37 threonylcarbamoyl transferase component Bud32